MPRRVLVLSASVGAGHMRAAQAVELAVRRLAPDAVVRNLDVLELSNRAFQRVYGKAYLDLVNKAPHMLGYFYDLLDKPGSKRRIRDRLRLAVEKLNLGPFLRFLREEPWDVAINTHFLPAEIIASLRKHGRLRMPQFTVTTDFETHWLWVNQPCDHYFTATEEGALYLENWGVPKADITVSGIPIHPAFSQPPNRAECLKRHGLVGDRPILLQMFGGFGVGPIERLYQAVSQIETPLEVVVITGRNEAMKKKLERIPTGPRHRVHLLGFTEHVHELMAVADLLLSKPGGLTTSEALASGTALAVVNPTPGQESRNSDFLLENGAAIKINNIATLPFKLTQLFQDRGRLAQLKANAQKLGRPRAAFDVARKALELRV